MVVCAVQRQYCYYRGGHLDPPPPPPPLAFLDANFSLRRPLRVLVLCTRTLYSRRTRYTMPNQPPADEALQNHLDYTRKRMGSRARERDVQRSLQWRFRMRITFEPEHFVLVDESAADGRTGTRRMGYSKRGSI
jgi:hypothetical protein